MFEFITVVNGCGGKIREIIKDVLQQQQSLGCEKK